MTLLTVHNPWLLPCATLTDAELRIYWQTLNQRDVTQWQGVELTLILAAIAACRDELKRRGLIA
jgi:hypothetical protein